MLSQPPPIEFTKQENCIAECLDQLGFRYEQQVVFGEKVVDFYLIQLNCVIECDGFYGHWKKGDKQRDAYLLSFGIEKIIHIKSTRMEEAMSELKGELCLE